MIKLSESQWMKLGWFMGGMLFMGLLAVVAC